MSNNYLVRLNFSQFYSANIIIMAVGLPADVSPVVKGAGAHFTPVQTMEDSSK